MRLIGLTRGAIGLFLLAVISAMLVWSANGWAETLQIRGAGSTFAAPLYFKWFDEYRKVAPGVQFSYEAVGSGRGIHDVMLGLTDFGGTDGPLTKTQMLDFSTHRNCEVLHFPVALGADVPSYNITGMTQKLNFTSRTLADIFLGKVTKWNDPEIAAANPGASLPARDLVVIHRSDGSGTTYVWTDYLSKVSDEWRDKIGVGISVNWPVGLAGRGNEGVVDLIRRTPYSIGYVELLYAIRNKLSYGQVQNRAGQFIRADLATVTAAAAGAVGKMPDDFRVSITNPPGKDAYPISSFTWLLIPSVISNQAKRTAIIDFLHWALGGGQNLLPSLTYAVLPEVVIAKEQKALGEISDRKPDRFM